MYVNNKLIHYKKKHRYAYTFYRKKLRNKIGICSDPDPLFLEADPRIRIHIKMKRIRHPKKLAALDTMVLTQEFEKIVCL